MKKSGRILITADLGSEYGFVDVDGKINIDILLSNMFNQSRSFFAILMRKNKLEFRREYLLTSSNEHYIPVSILVSANKACD